MSKKAWDDSHKYNVKLSVREMRIISCALTIATEVALETKGYHHMSKINMRTMAKLQEEFGKYSLDYFRWSFYPDTLGRDRAIRVEPLIDKP